ncbi:arylesterase [Candidatus Berkiella cookevillensis]|uniref:Arylesterase n=2 Tax=Candidatus Berkiella cookevillensis TaxID=437022 RepID=A0AAE3HM86_9GAMM|nr:arylesterase [Candidatus Berkiella cookevillensis]MCS5707437.1 arylesterase [Candidatus Berkiella cookevillensis]
MAIIMHNLSQVTKIHSNVKWLICLLACIFSFSTYANSNPILILGDSLSAAYQIPEEQGWVALLAEELKITHPNWQVLNHSISGETTAGGRQRLPHLLKEHQPKIVIIELGGNDGLRGLPILMISKNLESMIEMCKKADSQVLLIGMKLPPNYSEKYTQQFENIYRRLSKRFDIPLLPFLLENVALDNALMQSDRIHPTADAQPILLESVRPVLLPLLSDAAQ